MQAAWIRLLVLGGFISITPSFAANNAEFPGKPPILKSPDGAYAIVNKDIMNREPNHELYFEQAQKACAKKTKKKFYEYIRSVEVLWAPDSKRFVVNDLVGSNMAFPMLFSVDNLKEPIDLSELLTNNVKDKKDKASLTKNDHVYCRCVRWITAKRIEVCVTGHGDVDQSGFTLFYEHDLGRGFKKLKRTREEKLVPLR